MVGVSAVEKTTIVRNWKPENHFTYVCLPRTAVFMLSSCIFLPYLPFWINLNIFPSFISFSLPSFNFIALYHAPHFIPLEQGLFGDVFVLKFVTLKITFFFWESVFENGSSRKLIIYFFFFRFSYKVIVNNDFQLSKIVMEPQWLVFFF